MIPIVGEYYLINSYQTEIATGQITPIQAKMFCSSNIPETDCECSEKVFEFETIAGMKFYFGESEIIQRLF